MPLEEPAAPAALDGDQRTSRTPSGGARAVVTDSSRDRTCARIASCLALLLIGLGSLVMLGWIFRIPVLTQVVPGFTSMVFATAACFCLMGFSLLAAECWPGRASRAGARVAAVAVLGFAVLNLFQIASGKALGLNLPGLHEWMRDGNPVPGQMSTPTSVEFVLASLALLFLHSPLLRRPWARRLARAASALVFGIAALALVGYLLKFESLYSWYAFSRMAAHTAAGMIALSLALWWRQNQLEDRAPPSAEDRIRSLAGWTLGAVALVAGLAGAWILKGESERERVDALRLIHRARVDLLSNTLELRATRAALVAARPELRALLRSFSQGRPPLQALGDPALELLQSFAPFGFSAIELRGADGRSFATMGQALGEQMPSLNVGGALPGAVQLTWRQGVLLRQRFEIREGPVLLGYVLTEQPIAALDRILALPDAIGRTSETELCGASAAGLLCLPNRSHARPYVPEAAPRSPSSAILDAGGTGGEGVGTYRGADSGLSVAAYGPVGATGLLAATSLSSAELYRPILGRLLLGLTLVILITAGGVLVLRRAIHPLAADLNRLQLRYRSVVETLQEGMLLQDRDSAVLAVNPAATRILGAGEEEIRGAVAGDPRWTLLYGDGRRCAPEDYPAPRALRVGRGESNTLYGLIDPTGRLRWLEVSSALTRDGSEPAVVVTFSDVTESRLAQARLDEVEARFQMMVEQVSDYAILMLDAEGRVASWNEGARRIKGYVAEEVIGAHFSLFFTEEDRAAGRPQQALDAAALQGRYEFEGWRRRKDGSQFWSHLALTAVRDASGNLIGFGECSHDLSERHRAEQAVNEAWRRMQAMIDSSPFGIVATDLQGLIVAMNPAGLRMTGYTREELVGRLTPAVYHDPEEIVTRARELSEETGKPIAPGLETFVYKARLGLNDEREWTCVRKDGTRFPIHAAISPLRDPDGALVGFMGVAYDISERKRQEEYTRHIAHHDFLTGLPMRRLMEDRLRVAMKRAQRFRARVGLLMIDLDHFKRINDSLGHHVGDELLKAIAERLLGCVRDCDTVARMGGDEFVVVLPEIGGSAGAERIAALIVERVSMPVHIGQHLLHVSPSVGVAVFPDDSDDVPGLLKSADAAMYSAKLAGRGCFRTFTQQMLRDADQRMLLENDLRAALQDEALAVHYQPQVALGSGDVIGMEALLRWTHPQRGPVSPSVFIPIAEESGLIVQLGEWVLITACRAAKRLQLRTGVPLRLAVNLSPRQFRSPGLPDLIAKTLKDSGLDPTHLEIEITEGILMKDADEAIERLNRIRALGVTVAVDDFGTGYSSLAYITRFAIDTLKIDRSFVSQLPHSASDSAVAETILSLSRSLDIKVVAEGVETAAQLAFLQQRRCDAGQGFLLGMPGPEDRFSVQGFHFSAAMPEDGFAQGFGELQSRARVRVRGVPEVPA